MKALEELLKVNIVDAKYYAILYLNKGFGWKTQQCKAYVDAIFSLYCAKHELNMAYYEPEKSDSYYDKLALEDFISNN